MPSNSSVEADTPKLSRYLVNQQPQTSAHASLDSQSNRLSGSRPALLAQCPFLLLRPRLRCERMFTCPLQPSRLSEAISARSLQNSEHPRLNSCGLPTVSVPVCRRRECPLCESFESFGVANQDADALRAELTMMDMGVARPMRGRASDDHTPLRNET